MQTKEILELLNNTTQITRGEKPTAQGLAILSEIVAAEFTAEEVAIAIQCHLAESPFFPVFSDICKHINNPKNDAWEAWAALLEHIRRCGYTQPPVLEPATQAAVDSVGGYRRVCEIPSDKINLAASQFVRSYEAHRGAKRYRALVEERQRYLIGKSEEEIANP